MAVSYLDFLEELVYPVFINGVNFNFEDLNRENPKWWWSNRTKEAFSMGKLRLTALYSFRASSFYNNYPAFDRFYKIRDFLNTGNMNHFPKETDSKPAYSGVSSHLMNRIIQGG